MQAAIETRTHTLALVAGQESRHANHYTTRLLLLLLLLHSPAISLGFPNFGEIFACDSVNPTIMVVTFRLRRWCMQGVFLLQAFTRLGHECQDVDVMECMCAQTRPRFILSSKRVWGGGGGEGNGVRTHVHYEGKKSPLAENFPQRKTELLVLMDGCLSSQQHASVTPGTGLLRQLYVLTHRGRRCRSNLLSHLVTAY